jgi:hypothetical protein
MPSMATLHDVQSDVSDYFPLDLINVLYFYSITPPCLVILIIAARTASEGASHEADLPGIKPPFPKASEKSALSP